MGAQMLPRRGPSPPRSYRRPSFAGRGLLERTRSTGFALLGITTAMGLGLVALVSQQNWPYLPASPIPEYGGDRGGLDSAIVVALPPAGFGMPASHGPARKGSLDRGTAPAGTNDSRLSRSDQVSVGPDVSGGHQASGESTPPPAPAGPDSRPPVPPPPPSGAPAPPASAPSPAATNPSARSDPPAVASGNPGKGNAYGRQKATASRGNPSRPPPHASPTPVTPSAMPEATPAPAAPGTDGPGNGHGNAYGHDK